MITNELFIELIKKPSASEELDSNTFFNNCRYSFCAKKTTTFIIFV